MLFLFLFNFKKVDYSLQDSGPFYMGSSSELTDPPGYGPDVATGKLYVPPCLTYYLQTRKHNYEAITTIVVSLLATTVTLLCT